jgi:nickel-dependent lactate racemase
MRIGIHYGTKHVEITAPDGREVGVGRALVAPPLTDPAGAVRDALESPHGFPPLRRALTPDDHVAVVVEEHLPHFVQLLTPVLEHLTAAGVAPGAITLVCPASAGDQAWLEDLPEAFEDVHVEVHDPHDRRHLSYLATTKRGRRIYLNRTVVDADQVVVLAGRHYDPVLGYAGAAGALYPGLSDETTLQETGAHVSAATEGRPSPVGREAAEVAWLLGAPFLVQIIEGAGEDIAHVVAGPADTSALGQRLLEERWRVIVDEQADTVVATLTGDPARHNFADLAQALAGAARVVRPGGRIVLLTEAGPSLGEGAQLLRQAETPDAALALLRQAKVADRAAALLWAGAAAQAQIYLLSSLPDETAEELFAVPMQHAEQVQRLLEGGGTYLALEDTHKVLAVAAEHVPSPG